jgi:hypothetical protein
MCLVKLVENYCEVSLFPSEIPPPCLPAVARDSTKPNRITGLGGVGRSEPGDSSGGNDSFLLLRETNVLMDRSEMGGGGVRWTIFRDISRQTCLNRDSNLGPLHRRRAG